MDFIKTSSLRALIELTFQRNWNGLIWMSRKGVTTKRVKTVQTALSRISAQPRSPAGRGTNVPRSAKIVRPSEVSAKVQNRRPITQSRPGKHCPRSATPQLTPRRARPKRASREQASRPRNCLAYHGRCIRPSRELRRPAERFHRPNLIRPTTRPTTNPSGHDRSDSAQTRSVRPIVPTDRPNAAVDPKPVLKPISYFQARLNPKPPLKDLALYI
ncbi:unnamed protein product [Microthlaspi erraticum]|uniref:Uncharacterized protein n=1 Tax=Microthlaspi erraticum TaxID=1685480 RepID=A0A6D2IXB9_9BRAS|nr:unnamed protein product [Microthlaspi erraticum]